MATEDSQLTKDEKELKDAKGEDYLLRVGEVEKKLEELEIQKLNCFTFIVELLEVIVERLKWDSNQSRENE